MKSMRAICNQHTLSRVGIPVIILAVFSVIWPNAIQAAPRENELYNAVKGLIKKTVDKVAKQVTPQPPVVVAAQPEFVVTEAELEKRQERLTAFSECMQGWIAKHAQLSAEQTAAMAAMVANAIKDSQLEHANQAGQQQTQLMDFFPIRMTGKDGAATDIDLRFIRQRLPALNLTTAQQQSLDKAIEERQQFHKDGALERVLNLLDRELFLTSDQRDAIGARCRKDFDLKEQCYGLQANNHFIRQRAVSPILRDRRIKPLLLDAQKKRAQDLAQKNGSNQHVFFQLENGNLEQKLTDAIVSQKQRLKNACDVRVAFYASTHALSDDHARHLSVAGKGTVDSVISEWKQQTRRSLNAQAQHAAQNLHMHFHFVVADINKIEKDELWKATLAKLTDSAATDSTGERAAQRRAGMAMFVVALLDRELWLTAEQRQELMQVVLPQMPDPDYSNHYRQHFEELLLLAVPLMDCSQQDLHMLSANQKSVIGLLRKQYEFNGRHATISMRQNGQFTIEIPD